jgi:hypothetical protein
MPTQLKKIKETIISCERKVAWSSDGYTQICRPSHKIRRFQKHSTPMTSRRKPIKKTDEEMGRSVQLPAGVTHMMMMMMMMMMMIII